MAREVALVGKVQHQRLQRKILHRLLRRIRVARLVANDAGVMQFRDDAIGVGGRVTLGHQASQQILAHTIPNDFGYHLQNEYFQSDR